jgi:hypothetical protein
MKAKRCVHASFDTFWQRLPGLSEQERTTSGVHAPNMVSRGSSCESDLRRSDQLQLVPSNRHLVPDKFLPGYESIAALVVTPSATIFNLQRAAPVKLSRVDTLQEATRASIYTKILKFKVSCFGARNGQTTRVQASASFLAGRHDGNVLRLA